METDRPKNRASGRVLGRDTVGHTVILTVSLAWRLFEHLSAHCKTVSILVLPKGPKESIATPKLSGNRLNPGLSSVGPPCPHVGLSVTGCLDRPARNSPPASGSEILFAQPMVVPCNTRSDPCCWCREYTNSARMLSLATCRVCSGQMHCGAMAHDIITTLPVLV